MLAEWCVTWLHSRDNDRGIMIASWFVDITSCPGDEREKVYLGELSFPKLGSVLAGLSRGVLNFS